ncbi:MAG: hypothetical protein Phog2KO_22790 [Phototrophicaceae bacterium]
MLQGVIQRLYIIRQSDTQLNLREYPLLDWAVAFFLGIIVIILMIADFQISAGVAGGVALFFIIQARIRTINFDTDSNIMQIGYQSLLRQQVATEILLSDIQRAYLYKGDDEGTQIILVHVKGEELGISVYSEDISVWKDDIVIAINAILYEAHKDDGNTD